MVIREIHIDGFGIFNGFSLRLPEKGVSIIVGHNEAGKSTLLRFIRYTLFGYPTPLDERMPPLQGGSHGGRIKALLSSGSEATFERAGNNKIKLYSNGSESNNQSQWTQLLGNASAQLFHNVYGFTLDELVGFNSLKSSGVADKIFSLGMGLGDISVSAIESNLLTRVNNIYASSRAHTRLIPTIVSEISEKQGRVRLIQENLGIYKQLAADIELLSSQTESCGHELRDLRQQYASLDAYLRCYDSFVEMKRADEQLSQLPPWQSFPEKGVQQMENAMELEPVLTDKIKHLDEGAGEEMGLTEINNILETVKVNVPLLESKEKVDFVRLNLASYKQNVNERAAEGQELKELEARVVQTITEKISSQWSEHDVKAFKDLAVYQGQAEQFSTSLRTTTEEKRDWDAREKAIMATQRQFNTAAIGSMLAVASLIGAVPFFYYGLFYVGGALLIIALIFYFGRKTFQKTDPLVPIRQKIVDLEQEQKKVLIEYRTWLKKELRLSPELSFNALNAVFNTIEQSKGLLIQRDRLRTKIQEERLPRIYDFESHVRDLCVLIGHSASDTEVAATMIIEEYDNAMGLYNEIIDLTDEKARKEKEKKSNEEKLQETKEIIAKLLASVGVTSIEDYFRKYAENDIVANLQQMRKTAFERIETVAGYQKGEQVVEFLNTRDKQTLETQLSELDLVIKEKESQAADLHKQRGAKAKEKERIAGESDLAQLLTELETDKEKLAQAYKEWLSGQLALKVLADVKASFEQEKQPEVIRRSGGYFQSITEGKYAGIRTSIEGQEVSIYDSREVARGIGQLSRGTREQLLISLRLGFVEEYEQQAEPLPIVVDEILVNSDPRRARQTAHALHQFATNRQLLLFTCHPSTVQLFDPLQVNVIQLGEIK